MPRTKYEGSLNEIPGPDLQPKEPYFVLRGNDKLALETLRAYLDAYVALNPSLPAGIYEDDDRTIAEILSKDENWKSLQEIVRRFTDYQYRFSSRVKYPD